jgi:hypothetical protein
MNPMNPIFLIILGAIIIFGVPAGVGWAMARWTGNLEAGIVMGVVIFLCIVFFGYRYMMKVQKKGDHRKDE